MTVYYDSIIKKFFGLDVTEYEYQVANVYRYDGPNGIFQTAQPSEHNYLMFKQIKRIFSYE